MTRGCVLLLFTAGCLESIGPDVGPLAPTAPVCPGDSDPAVAVTYRIDIAGGVLSRGGCMNCHTGGGMGLAESGLDMRTYMTLRTGGGRTGAAIVITGDPCASIIVQKIETAPPFGRRMPYDGPPYLSLADIQLVRDWIAEGARDN